MMQNDADWVLAKKSLEDGGLSLVRIRKFESKFDVYPERLTVIWPFQEKTPTNAPSEMESEAMERFENRLCKFNEKNGEAVLLIVFTEPGYREYTFYSRDVDAFMEALNEIPADKKPYPIEIHHETDDSGEFYNSYASRLLNV